MSPHLYPVKQIGQNGITLFPFFLKVGSGKMIGEIIGVGVFCFQLNTIHKLQNEMLHIYMNCGSYI